MNLGQNKCLKVSRLANINHQTNNAALRSELIINFEILVKSFQIMPEESWLIIVFDKILLHLQSFLRNTLELLYSVYVIIHYGFNFIQF